MSRKSKNNSVQWKSDLKTAKLGTGCLILFALPFALIGAGTGSSIVYDLWMWQAAQRWVETPAQILESSLETDSDGDGETHTVVARYSYEYGGKAYEGDRVTLQGGQDSVGTYQQDRATALEGIKKAGGKTVCYVNPHDPSQAMLYRDVRIGLLGFKLMFTTIFGGVGFGLLAAAFYGRRAATHEANAKRDSPGEPWLWRRDWASGRIRSSGNALLGFVTFFAVCWNAMTWPVVLSVWGRGQQDSGPPWLLLALFPLAGFGVGCWAAYLWLQRLRWGVSEFEMVSTPGVIGGPLAGIIRAPRSMSPENGFVLRLACDKSTTTRSSDGSSTETETLWESEHTIFRDLATADGGSTMIPVKFLVPYERQSSGENIKWKLSVKAEMIGVDYAAEFEVPVYRTRTSSPDMTGAAVRAQAEAGGEAAENLSIEAVVARLSAVLEEKMTDSRVIRFPMGRNRGMAAFLVMFAAVWGGVAYVVTVSEGPRLVAGGVGILAGLFGLLALGVCFATTRLEYGSRGVSWSHGWFGLGRRREVPRARILSISLDKLGTTHGETSHRHIVLTDDAREHIVVNQVARTVDAQALVDDMRRVLRLDERDGGGGASLEADLPKDFL